MNCPRCGSAMSAGYTSASSPLSWIDEGKFDSFAFKDEDLARAGLKTIFPWKGEYFRSSNCAGCKVIVVDYSRKHDRKAIDATRDPRIEPKRPS